MLRVVLYASLTMMPQLLQNQMGYTAELAGLAISSGGLTIVCFMPVVGFLVGKTDARWLSVFGFTAMALSMYYSRNIDLQMSFSYASWLRVYQCVGLAFLFVPISSLAYVGMDPNKSNDVSGLTNLARNIGGSCGTAMFTTVLSRQRQAQLNEQQAKLQQTLQNAPRQILIRNANVLSRKASVDSSAAQVRQDKLNLTYCHIVAPVSGLVTQRTAEVGARISVGQQLMMVV